MTTTAAVGCIVIAASLALCTFLVLWSRRTIELVSSASEAQWIR